MGTSHETMTVQAHGSEQCASGEIAVQSGLPSRMRGRRDHPDPNNVGHPPSDTTLVVEHERHPGDQHPFEPSLEHSWHHEQFGPVAEQQSIRGPHRRRGRTCFVADQRLATMVGNPFVFGHECRELIGEPKMFHAVTTSDQRLGRHVNNITVGIVGCVSVDQQDPHPQRAYEPNS